MRKIILIIVLLSCVVCLKSQNTDKNKYTSSKKELIDLYFKNKGIYGHSIDDYFKTPSLNTFQLSPNGLNVSFIKIDYEGKNNLFIKNIHTGEVNRIVDSYSKNISEYLWIDDNHIAYIGISAGSYKINSIDVHGRHNKCLATFKNAKPKFIQTIKNTNKLIVELFVKDQLVGEPHILDLETGSFKRLFIDLDEDDFIIHYLFDKKGELKGYLKKKDSLTNQMYFKSHNSEVFTGKISVNWKTTFKILSLDHATSNPNDAIVLTNMNNNTNQIIRYDLEKDTILEILHSHKHYDIESIYMSSSDKRIKEIDSYSYFSDKLQTIPVSKHFKKVHKKIKSKFKSENYKVITRTDDENSYLIKISSDKIYGKLYMYNVSDDIFTEISNLMPHLRIDYMAQMRSFKVNTRDGLSLSCFLCVPKDLDVNEKVPMIVKVHKDPFTSRDTWSFNRESQLFANRGFATLHVNYRGSYGYGKNFKIAGYKQTGRKIIEDIEDAIKHVLKFNIIDEDRLAIYGEYYGGSTALQCVIKNPDLFKCAVAKYSSCNLKFDIQDLFAYDIAHNAQYHEQFYNPYNSAEKQIISQISPLNNVSEITKPILFVESDKSILNPLNRKENMQANLKSRNIDSYIIIDNTKQNLYNDETHSYEAILGFFMKYL